MIKLMDDNNDGFINQWEFCKALKDFKVGMHPRETEQVFNLLVPSKHEELEIDAFMSVLLGRISDFRRGVIERSFDVLDHEGKGFITVDRLRQSYNSRRHPDVIYGKKTVDETLGEFVSLFDAFHSGRTGKNKESITRQEFFQFFNYMSPMIPDDNDFESIVLCSRANIPNQEKKPLIQNPITDNTHEIRSSRAESRYQSNGTHRLGVIAPYGLSNEAFYQTSYSAFNYPNEKQLENFNSKNKYAAGVTSWPGTHYADPRKLELEEKNQRLISQITDTLASRGIAGFLHLLESFQNCDKSRSGLINFGDFQEGRILLFSSPP